MTSIFIKHSAYSPVMNTGNSRIKFDSFEVKLPSCLRAECSALIIEILSRLFSLGLRPPFPFVGFESTSISFVASLQIVGRESCGYVRHKDLIETFWSC